MNLKKLSLESMPSLNIPFRFFITSSIFGIMVGVLLLLSTPDDLSSRWSPLMLAATHGLTLGFMLMVMFGALFQIFPVVLGMPIPKANSLSRWVYFFLVIGIISLVLGLYSAHFTLLLVSIVSLTVAITVFLLGLLACLPTIRDTPSSKAIRFAILSLLITVCLGLLFIAAWVQPDWFVGYRDFTNIHLLWGSIGWVFLLVMGVSFQIIPMFYVTPDYPKLITHFLPVIIFVELLMTSILYEHTFYGLLFLTLLAVTTAIYPIYTLYLFGQRKRKAKDMTIVYWKTAMSAYLISDGLFLCILFYDGEYIMMLKILLGLIFIFGFAITLMIGMLIKIVPFLVWLNLQQTWVKYPAKRMPLSNMQQVLPNAIAKKQYYLLTSMLAVLFVLFSGGLTVWMVKLGALLIIINFGYLFYNLMKAKQLYNRLDKELKVT